MTCSICHTDHQIGAPHRFPHINKVVSRPGCTQCDARDRVIEQLVAKIEHLHGVFDAAMEVSSQKRPNQAPEIANSDVASPALVVDSQSERMKARWARVKAQGKNRL